MKAQLKVVVVKTMHTKDNGDKFFRLKAKQFRDGCIVVYGNKQMTMPKGYKYFETFSKRIGSFDLELFSFYWKPDNMLI